jgi:hypothetical protein
MTTYSKSGSFGWAGGGKGGAIVDLWAQSRFGSPPAENAAPPSGSPDGGPVTTGTAYGSPGAFTVTVTTIQDYYLRVQYGGQSYWSAVAANDLAGAPVASGVTNVSAADASLIGTSPTTTPTFSRAALTGDVTASAGSNATSLVGTSNVESIIAANSTVAGKLNTSTAAATYETLTAAALLAPLASPTFTGTVVGSLLANPAGRIFLGSNTSGSSPLALPNATFLKGGMTTTSGWLYMPQTGVYHASGVIILSVTGGTPAYLQTQLFKNGSLYAYGNQTYVPSNGLAYVEVNDDVSCTSGDYLQLGFAGSVSGTFQSNTRLSVHMVSQ